MHFDGGAIDQNLRGWSAAIRERVEQIDPHAWTPPKTSPSGLRFDSVSRSEAEVIRCAASLDFSID